MRGKPGGGELGGEERGVAFFVLRLVVLRVAGAGEFAGGCGEGVPVGHVDGEPADLAGGAGGFVDLGEDGGAGLEVGVPSEPVEEGVTSDTLERGS